MNYSEDKDWRTSLLIRSLNTNRMTQIFDLVFRHCQYCRTRFKPCLSRNRTAMGHKNKFFLLPAFCMVFCFAFVISIVHLAVSTFWKYLKRLRTLHLQRGDTLGHLEATGPRLNTDPSLNSREIIHNDRFHRNEHGVFFYSTVRTESLNISQVTLKLSIPCILL